MFNFYDARILCSSNLECFLQQRQGGLGICGTGKGALDEGIEGLVLGCALLQVLPVDRVFGALAGALSIHDQPTLFDTALSGSQNRVGPFRLSAHPLVRGRQN